MKEIFIKAIINCEYASAEDRADGKPQCLCPAREPILAYYKKWKDADDAD